MSEINLSDYVLESKSELNSLANVIKEKSGVEGPLSVEQMTEQAATLYPTSVLASLIDRSIKEIEIPLSVTTIGRNAFTYCNSLENVKLHEGITLIGASAFANCGVKEFEFPKSISSLEFGVLQSCSSLKKVTIPDTVTTIKQQALGFCASLATLTLPNSVNDISPSAFVDSKKLATIYCDWAEGEKPTLEAKAPWGATNAEIVYIGSTQGLIFALNTEGTGYAVQGFDYTHVPKDEYDTPVPTNVFIADSYKGLPVVGIAPYAFSRAGNTILVINNIRLPNTLTSIGEYAFSDQRITSVTLPVGIIDIGIDAFAYCYNLTDIYVPWAEGDVANAPWGAENATIHYNHTT